MRLIPAGTSAILIATLITLGGCSRGEDDKVPAQSTQDAPAQTTSASDPSPTDSSPESAPDEPDDPAPDPASTTPVPAPAADPPADLEARLAIGAEAFVKAKCTTCHANNGTGTRYGPSLVDKTWIHCDGSVQGIHDVIIKGLPVEAFKNPKYGMKMSPVTKYITDEDEIMALAVYVHSLSQK